MLAEAIGWAASVVLLATMMRQVWSQWRNGTAAGVSSWLFVGQVAASTGFTVYSLLLGNAVFIVTNGLMLVNAVIGLWLDRRNRRRSSAAPARMPYRKGTRPDRHRRS